MDNLYQPSTSLTSERFKELELSIEAAWGIDTADPNLRDVWTEGNKALGQCAVTSLFIYDLFG